MDAINLDIFAILAATLAGMVLGAIWYSPVAFGNQWMQSIGKTRDQLGSATGPMLGSIVASFLSATGVAIMISLSGIDTPINALWLGLSLGLLIIFPAMLSDNLFCGWGTRLLLIQVGYRIVSIALMSVIIASMA